MVHKMYALFDRVAKLHGPVFQAVNHGVARRNVIHFLEKVSKYDRDSYELHLIGDFDDESGTIVSEGPVFVEIDIPDFEDVEVKNESF